MYVAVLTLVLVGVETKVIVGVETKALVGVETLVLVGVLTLVLVGVLTLVLVGVDTLELVLTLLLEETLDGELLYRQIRKMKQDSLNFEHISASWRRHTGAAAHATSRCNTDIRKDPQEAYP